jgi:hypothetical protein
VTTVTTFPRHLRQLFLLADVLLFQVIDRLTIPSTQLVDYTHSQNKHKILFFGGFKRNRFSESEFKSVCSVSVTTTQEQA